MIVHNYEGLVVVVEVVLLVAEKGGDTISWLKKKHFMECYMVPQIACREVNA
jgi:hypothetical protein